MSLSRLVLALIACVAAALACAAPAVAYDSQLDTPYDVDGVTTALNKLDIYTPTDAEPGERRPLIVWVHGGGWATGDKANRIPAKAQLFTELGYVFTSVNYRLSPNPPDTADADRVRFPAQPHDIGEALGWLSSNAAAYGASNRKVVLIGHSAGAQLVALVATDPAYVGAYFAKPWQIVGAISLDTDAFDIAEQATQTGNLQNRTLIWNAFATPAENAASPVWNTASAINAADALDPPMLLATSLNPKRLAANRAMAGALGQDPGEVLSLPYSHEQFNTGLGTADGAAETQAVIAFIRQALTDAKPPLAKLIDTPRKRVEADGAGARVTFRFVARPKGSASGFQCRLGVQRWAACDSPDRLTTDLGRHVFRVRALSDRGRPGLAKKHIFRVVRR